MAFSVEDAAEAYAAISLLVVGADGVGTMDERHFLFDELANVDVFHDHDAESLGALLGGMVGRMYSELSNDGVVLDADAVTDVCSSARGVLDDSQCHELFSLAVHVAYSDGMDSTERVLLTQIADGLGVDAEEAESMIAGGGD